MALHTAITGPELRRLAVLASADPRTVARVLRGERVLPLVRERIEQALRERGHAVPTIAKEARDAG